MFEGVAFGYSMLCKTSASVDIYNTRNPLPSPSFTGSGERVCVLPAPPVDRSDLWLQAAGT